MSIVKIMRVFSDVGPTNQPNWFILCKINVVVHLHRVRCLVVVGEGDDDDGGEDGQPDQVGGGEDEGRDDAVIAPN